MSKTTEQLNKQMAFIAKAGTLGKLAEAAGIPSSDVPTVRVAANKAEAEKMMAGVKA